ncbi:AI-2E family transporter [Gryllotalpicola daejeonensis]|uniref:AI-2E family transporter n=1 Tax=Gryllotalpicola daejeonensis TaxID=993087 RepID=A0ABP7ZGV7_9MICO
MQRQPAPHTFWASLSNPFAVGFMLTLGGLAAFVLGLAIESLSQVLAYISIALFAALGLDPVVRRLERARIGRARGIVIVYAGFAVLVAAVLWLIVPAMLTQETAFLHDLPGTIASFRHGEFYEWLRDAFGSGVDTALSEAENLAGDPVRLADLGGGVAHLAVTIGTGLSGAVIVLVLSLYFLASLPAIKAAFTRLMPARSRPTASRMLAQIADSIGSYLGGMVVLAFFNAVVVFLLYLFLGLPFPVLMAVIAFAVTLVPLVGSVVFWVFGGVVALLSGPVAALVFAVVYLIYMQIEAYVLTPRVMNRAVAVPGALVVIGALVGGTLLGILGALVAIPVTASVLLIVQQLVIPRQDAKV